MKILKKILIFLVVLVGLIVIVSAFLPGTVKVERRRVIPASKETVFNLVNTLKNWDKWSPWKEKDTAAVMTYSEQAAGKGAWYTWKGNKEVGEGKLTITDSWGTDSLIIELDFMEQGKGMGGYYFFEKEKGTEVVWTMTSEMPFMFRIMGLFMDGMLGPDFEKGLENMEKAALAEPAKPVMTFTVEQSKEMNCLCMTDSCVIDPKTMSEMYGRMYRELEAEMKAQKLNYAGAPFSINERYDEAKNFLVFTPGIPVSGEVKQTKNKKVKFCKCEAQKVLVYNYFGDDTKMQPAYEAMYKHIGENKMEVAGNSWEEYITDPGNEPDTAKWNTKIYIPIK